MTTESNLFVVRSRPVKIFLEGFVYRDVLTIARLILTHGGVVVSEPDEETIVLSPLSGSSSMQYARFNVNWLHDCISANDFLDVVKYILPTAEFRNSVNEKMHHIKIETDVTANTSPSWATRTNEMQPRVVLAPLHPKTSSRTAEEKGIESTTDDVKEAKHLIEDQVEISSELDDFHRNEVEANGHNERRKSPTNSSKSTSTCRDADLYASCSSSDTTLRIYKRYSVAETQSMVDYVIKNNAFSKASGRVVWEKAKAEGMFEHRSVDSLKQHFRSCLRHDLKQYTSDQNALKEFEKLKKLIKSSQAIRSYSEEEKKRMIQFIVERRAFGRLTGTEIWQEMERDSIFRASHRSASNLRHHFRQYMSKSLHKYTQNSEDLKQFRSYVKRAAVNKRTCRPYLVTETREMIDYLVKNNALSRGGGRSVWMKAKANGMFVNRSVDSLMQHFRRCLPHDCRRYTSDQNALKELEKLRKRLGTAKTGHSYSEEEKKRIIEFIVEKHATGRLNTVEIWRKMERDIVFRASNRSAANLRCYFRYNMGKSFHKYTKNSEALREFKDYFKSTAMNKQVRRSYSEQERHKMIQYLIDNRAISKALGWSVWQKAEADGIFIKPRRSANGLYCQFCKHLRYHYMNYTDDPEALSEFEKLTKQ